MIDNHELDWSQSVNNRDDHHEYLFRTQSSRSEFVEVETELAQLNDYCVVCLNATGEKLNHLRGDLARYQASNEPIIVEDVGDIRLDLVMGLEEGEIPTWERNCHFTAAAMCLVLLSCFTEKSLKSLSMALGPQGKSPRQSRGESKIGAYIRFLVEECGYAIEEPDTFVLAREKCRDIRNSFAHGEWDDITSSVSGTNLSGAFLAVSRLLSIIEAAVYPGETC